MKKLIPFILFSIISTIAFGEPSLKHLTIQTLLKNAAEPNTKILGSTLSAMPAVFASSLILKVHNLLHKHGYNPPDSSKSTRLQKKLLYSIAFDKKITTQIIHKKTNIKKLMLLSHFNIKNMITESNAISFEAKQVEVYCQKHKVNHASWYIEDLSAAKIMAHSSATALAHYLS